MTSDDAQTKITGFWSKVAPEYEAHAGNVPARESAEYGAWVDAIRDLLPPAPADVLDVATGTGFVAIIAARLGHRVTAIDASREMLQEAQAKALAEGVRVSFQRHDAVAPSLPPAGFDAIVSRHFIWTLREPERAFRNWRELLRLGGRVVVIDGFWFEQPQGDNDVPGDEGPPGLFGAHYTKETRAALPAMHATSTAAIVEMFRAAGFGSITTGDLARVHALAADPPATDPWYTLVAMP
jgi:SAM-dependent methyltransferase